MIDAFLGREHQYSTPYFAVAVYPSTMGTTVGLSTDGDARVLDGSGESIEGLYAVGLEPATNPFGNPAELAAQGYPVTLPPGESRRYELEFGILAGAEEIARFAESVEALA